MKIVLIHGALGSGKQFQILQELLLESGLDVDCPDLPWHAKGDSLNEPYTIPTLASWFLEKYQNQWPISIFSHSMGGYLGLYLMLHHKEKIHALTTLGTRIPWNEAYASKENNMLEPSMMKAKVPSFYQSLVATHPHCDLLLSKTQNLLTDLGMNNYLNHDALKGIHGKVQLICGDKDVMAGVDETIESSRLIPNCGLGILPNTVHPFNKADIHVLRQFILKNSQ